MTMMMMMMMMTTASKVKDFQTLPLRSSYGAVCSKGLKTSFLLLYKNGSKRHQTPKPFIFTDVYNVTRKRHFGAPQKFTV